MAKKYKHQKYFTFNERRYVVRADTYEELILKEHQKRQELEGKVKRIEKEMLIESWIGEWLETYKKPTVSSETFYSYNHLINRHILPVLKGMKLRSIQQIHCQKILNQMHSRGLAKGTMNIVSVLMKEIFRDAEYNNLILSSPAVNLRIPTGTKIESRALTEYEEVCCLRLSDSHPFGIVVKIMLGCGLRIGEVSALRWHDIDLENNILHVRHTLKWFTDVIGPPKTKASARRVPIPSDLAEYLRSIKGRPDQFLYRNENDEFIKTNRRNMEWISFKNDLNILMGCQADENGRAIPPYRVAPDLRPHYFRHTYCTHLQDAGVPINVARQLMGHTNITTTQKVYTHETDYTFESARNRIEERNRAMPAATPSATPG